ncbi:hypothetical protein BGZ92_005450, partial [Podila epicladia]
VEALIDGKTLSPYQVFKYKFHHRFINANDAEDAFGLIRDLCQKRSVNKYVTLFKRYHSHLNDFDDKDAVHFFRGGLKPELRQLINNHPDIASDDINSLIPMDLDLVRMQPNAQVKPQRSMSKDNVKKNDFYLPQAKEIVKLQGALNAPGDLMRPIEPFTSTSPEPSVPVPESAPKKPNTPKIKNLLTQFDMQKERKLVNDQLLLNQLQSKLNMNSIQSESDPEPESALNPDSESSDLNHTSDGTESMTSAPLLFPAG